MQKENSVTAVTARGNPTDPLLLFLHGGGATRYVWTPHLTMLADEYRAVAPDIPGHGQHPDDSFTYTGGIDTIERVLDDEDATEALLVGHSIGGYLALKAVTRLPNRIRGICLAGAGLNWRSLPRGIIMSVLAGIVSRALLGLAGHNTSISLSRHSYPSLTMLMNKRKRRQTI